VENFGQFEKWRLGKRIGFLAANKLRPTNTKYRPIGEISPDLVALFKRVQRLVGQKCGRKNLGKNGAI
jgi:hypothetical protein